MFVIGERINGMFTEVKKAVEGRDAKALQNLALRQLEAGADALDVNVGPTRGKAVDNMRWMIEAVQEVTDAPICVDTPKLDVMEVALDVCENPTVINSTKAGEEQLDRYVPLAVETGSRLIALTIDETGVPRDADGRVGMGATIVTKAMEHGLQMQDLYIDPVILPVNVAPKQPAAVMQAIGQLKLISDPPPNFILGLSNVSQNCKERSLLNSTYVAMCIGAGLNAAIMDALDEDLMRAAITAEVLLEKQLYCDDYVAAYMSNK
ncbi:MAG: dihydropteroate synthase [Candidatus Brocadiaceae bacterium]|jgi:5-methyltetrahydrofolate corrinoid/iron sulfur protein methyltransferase